MFAQLRMGRACLRGHVGAFDQAGRLQRGAARLPQRFGLRAQRRLRQAVGRQREQCARHQQRRFGGVVVQRTCAGTVRVDVGLAGHHRVQPVAVQFGGAQHRTAAIGDADRDHPGVVETERRGLRKRAIQRGQGEVRGLLHMPPPIGLGIVLRMGVLDRHAGGADRGIGDERQRFAQRAAAAVLAHAALRVQIEIVGTGALVGVGDRAALRQAPGAGHRDGAVDAARTRRGGDHHAAPLQIETIGHLHQYAMRLLRAGQCRQRAVLASGHRGGAAVDLAVTAGGGQIGDAAPVVPECAPAQFRRGRMGGVGEGRRGHRLQAGQAQAGGQQIVAAAVLGDALRFDHGLVGHGSGRGTAAGGQRQGQGGGQSDTRHRENSRSG